MSSRALTPESDQNDKQMNVPPTPVSAVKKTKQAKPRGVAKTGPKAKGSQDIPPGLLAVAWRHLVDSTYVDWHQYYAIGGYKNGRSLSETFRVTKNKYLENLAGVSGPVATGDNAPTGDADEDEKPVVPKKRRATGTAGARNSNKKARKDKAEEEELDDVE